MPTDMFDVIDGNSGDDAGTFDTFREATDAAETLAADSRRDDPLFRATPFLVYLAGDDDPMAFLYDTSAQS